MTKDLIEQLIKLGLNQSQIAKRAQIAHPSIHRILNGLQTDVSYTAGKRLETLIAELTGQPLDGDRLEISQQNKTETPHGSNIEG